MNLSQRLRKKKGLVKSPFQMKPSVSPETVIELLPKIAREITNARMALLEGELTDFKRKKLAELDEFVLTLQREATDAILEHIRTRAVEIQGAPGYTPVKGKDYFDGAPGKTPMKEVDYFDGKTPTTSELIEIILPLIPPPKAGSPDTGGQIVDKINEADSLIAMSKVAGLKEWLEKLSKRPGRGLLRGGGGDGGSSGVSFETPVGTVDGSNATFTVLNTPQYVIVDGITYFEDNGYSLTGLSITTNVPPTGFIRSAYTP